MSFLSNIINSVDKPQIRKNQTKLEQSVRTMITYQYIMLRGFNFNGTQLSVAYDTALAGAIKDDQQKPVFHEALEWLVNGQSQDGSWKAYPAHEQYFICDQMLSTIAAVTTLASYDKFKASSSVSKGLEWITQNVSAINDNDPKFIKSVGFELLFPSHLQRLNQIVPLDFDISKYIKMQESKLGQVSLGHIITGRTPVLFSIEFLDPQFNKEKMNLDYQISNNGSLACSPGATAWYASKTPKSLPTLLHYLRSTQQTDHGWPHFSDSKLFTLAYSLHIIQRSLTYIPQYLLPSVDYLYANWTPLGIGFSQYFPMPDFDDTILALNVLDTSNKISHDDHSRFWNVVNYYHEQDHFRSYPFEKDPSILVNLHTLDTLKDKTFAQNDVEHLLTFFRTILTQNGFFGKDKYHYSPFLQNTRGVIAFSNTDNSLALKCLNWFYEKLGSDGTWSNYPHRTLEEIIYTVMALAYYSLNIEKIDLDILTPSINYIIDHFFDAFEPVWISKVLYSPQEIQRANLFAALVLYYRALGNTIDWL